MGRGSTPAPRAVPRPRRTTTIRITAGRPHADVHPAPVDLLVPWLITARRVYSVGGPRGFRGETKRERHCQCVDGRVFFPVGLVPKVAAFRQQHGYAVEVVDPTPPRPRTDVDLGVVAKLDPDGADFVAAQPSSPHH